MIQRIQSFYLMVAALAAIFYIFYAPHWWLKVISGVCFFNFVLVIFFYKNRPLQLRLCMLSIASCFVLLGMQLYFFIDYIQQYFIQFAFTLVMFINVLLAIGGIKNDENLIKNMDRLR